MSCLDDLHFGTYSPHRGERPWSVGFRALMASGGDFTSGASLVAKTLAVRAPGSAGSANAPLAAQDAAAARADLAASSLAARERLLGAFCLGWRSWTFGDGLQLFKAEEFAEAFETLAVGLDAGAVLLAALPEGRGPRWWHAPLSSLAACAFEEAQISEAALPANPKGQRKLGLPPRL